MRWHTEQEVHYFCSYFYTGQSINLYLLLLSSRPELFILKNKSNFWVDNGNGEKVMRKPLSNFFQNTSHLLLRTRYTRNAIKSPLKISFIKLCILKKEVCSLKSVQLDASYCSFYMSSALRTNTPDKFMCDKKFPAVL